MGFGGGKGCYFGRGKDTHGNSDGLCHETGGTVSAETYLSDDQEETYQNKQGCRDTSTPVSGSSRLGSESKEGCRGRGCISGTPPVGVPSESGVPEHLLRDPDVSGGLTDGHPTCGTTGGYRHDTEGGVGVGWYRDPGDGQ